MLRAENAEVVIHPDDRRYGALLVGSQGSGKTSALVAFYANDVMAPDTAPIVIDPKSELSHICLRATPPGLRQARVVPRPRPPGVRDEPAATGRRPAAADRGRRDRRERRRCAAGYQREPDLHVLPPLPLPCGHRRDRPRAARAAPRQASRTSTPCCSPPRQDFRQTVAEACADQPDLDQTAAFFRSELPDELRIGRAAQPPQRLDAPRNKISRPAPAPIAAAVLQPPDRHRAAGDHRGAGHPDRRREHGRDRRGEQQGRMRLHAADAAHPDAAPGPPPRARAPARAAARSTKRTTSPASRTSSTRSPPTAAPGSSRHSACSTSRSSARAPSTSRRSARASSTCCKADSCSGWATPRTPRRPPGSRWPCTPR